MDKKPKKSTAANRKKSVKKTDKPADKGKTTDKTPSKVKEAKPKTKKKETKKKDDFKLMTLEDIEAQFELKNKIFEKKMVEFQK